MMTFLAYLRLPPLTQTLRFILFEDIPTFWDAWDLEVTHLEKGWEAGYPPPAPTPDLASVPACRAGHAADASHPGLTVGVAGCMPLTGAIPFDRCSLGDADDSTISVLEVWGPAGVHGPFSNTSRHRRAPAPSLF